MIKRALIATAILFANPAFVFSQDIFFSFGQGADVTNVETLSTSDSSGSAFIFSANGFDFTSADIDFSNSDDQVIQFTDVELFDNNDRFDSFIAQDPDMPGLDITPTSGNLTAVAIFANGISSEDAATDPDFDVAADAFLLARVDFDVIGEGTANLDFTLGEVGAANGLTALNPTFGSASLTVTSAVPEPSSVVLMALGSLGLISARRRRA